MKRFILFVLVMGITVTLFAQNTLYDYRVASGTWGLTGDRLYQNDANARLAKVNIFLPQSGLTYYDFNVRYEGGAEDGHGGFGLHVYIDVPYHAVSWGAGRSYLLWLNYDETPISNSGIPANLSGQVYRSTSDSQMELVHSISLNEYLPLLLANISHSIPFKISVSSTSGEVRVYDPTDPTMNTYYYFFINTGHIPSQSNWVALRTNGIKLSFGL